MKKFIFLFFACFLICINCFSQTGWYEINIGQNRIIRDIFFINSYTGWVVGDSTIFKSTNGGINWIRQDYTYGVATCLNSVRFINENTGFAAGGHHTGFYDFYYKYIFNTTNGGANWYILLNQQGSANSVITKIFPVNQYNIFFTSSGSEWSAASGGINVSTDGGITFPYFYSKGESNSLFCLNSNVAWASAYFWTDYPAWKGYILKTTNGGINWIEQYKDSLYNVTVINSIQFIDQNTGFVIGMKFNGKTKFFKTTNGGTNWDTILYTHRKYNCLFFVDQNTGWIGGSYYPDSSCISYTTNAGLSWTLQKKHYYCEVEKLYFINHLTGWATLYNSSKILKTTNGGITYTHNISNEIPCKYFLFQNYPNPFNPTTSIKYEISKSGNVLVKVFDILGKEITTLVSEKQSPGIYEVNFDGSTLPSGIYFYKLETDDFSDTKRMILLK